MFKFFLCLLGLFFGFGLSTKSLNFLAIYEAVNVTVVFVGAVHSSVSANEVPGAPPKATAAEVVPQPPGSYVASFLSFTSVQDVPLNNSVSVFGPTSPENARAAVLLAPAPPKAFLALFKSPVSVQAVPFHDSVNALAG